MPWPRIQFHELGDQPWCPSWLHHHEQFSLSRLWNLRVPFWSHGSLATQACAVIKEHLRNPSLYTIVDVCAGAGGPTPLIERELNRNETDAKAVRFVLTDMFPPVDVWAGIAKKQPNIEFVERAVDARSVARLSNQQNGRECRIFNICFHHFNDADAAGILGSAVREADAFLVFEITARQVSTCLFSPLVFFWGFYVTLFWYWHSPVHLLFTFLVPVAPLVLWVDGFISCLRTRTPTEIRELLTRSGENLDGWEFRSGEKSVQWPFITFLLTSTTQHENENMKVIIVGGGLGGLACAIACRRENLDVVVLERSSNAREVGAGIQIPPNGGRIIEQLGLLSKILEKGSTVQHVDFRRYHDGTLLRSMPFGEDIVEEFGVPWVIIHREDFHRVLLDEATRLGAEICLGAEVTDVVFEQPEVILARGERVAGDVIIGADGLYSRIRDIVLDSPTKPEETGDLAYRAIFRREQLEALNDPDVNSLCEKVAVTSWLGPDKHSIFYPVRGGSEFNLVLLRPDNLEKGTRRTQGDVEEMRESYAGWDETLGPVALLGDACHPTLPYQAQGAAMAVEDGFAIGKLLGLLNTTFENATGSEPQARLIPQIFAVYEQIRKTRTTRNVQAAARNRMIFHIPDGIVQAVRDFVLGYAGMTKKSDWTWLFSARMRSTLYHDLAGECETGFTECRISGQR
ncbi:hypothetical protein ASPVEDRAFT_54276 [Aspergillus versicolor CBS 583.65]|uniref:FAD-binding domain-containing protein n=1 Tax=Aspergillus versicolor CBS 583.65 TaxID=1036611 RepID=A0A1L9PRG7_ASPVE|nr:uncharacterized protein ASPVEDRAFT_54276 [Aspergillus versicolor CBS 583.65]OJJ04025.1 hypothetical protein ASPVEDRAFT_54276 [Aspergillus versicolor CBS 583.65]